MWAQNEAVWDVCSQLSWRAESWKLNALKGKKSFISPPLATQQGPTCRPVTCTRTGGSAWGRCSGSRSWVDRTGTFGTTFYSPCQSRMSGTPHSSSSALQNRCGARTPWSVRCGSPECGGKIRATARCRPPEPVPPPVQSPTLRSPAAGSVRSNKRSLCRPLCASTQEWVSEVNFLLGWLPPAFLLCFLQISQFISPQSRAGGHQQQWSSSARLQDPHLWGTICEHCCVTACYYYVNFPRR